MIDGVKHYSFATTTCFGAASSADVFHDLGSAAEFILRCATGNVVIVRYADDFLVLIPPLDSSPAHAQAMAARDCIIDVCDALGLPIAKFEGPAPSLVFVGTGIDTTLMRAFIPPECNEVSMHVFFMTGSRDRVWPAPVSIAPIARNVTLHYDIDLVEE